MGFRLAHGRAMAYRFERFKRIDLSQIRPATIFPKMDARRRFWTILRNGFPHRRPRGFLVQEYRGQAAHLQCLPLVFRREVLIQLNARAA